MIIPKNKPMITLLGVGGPIVDWNDTAFVTQNSTLDSATVGISGNNFMARNITFQVPCKSCLVNTKISN